MNLTDSDGEKLVRLARTAVTSHLKGDRDLDAAEALPIAFKQKARVFVTILTVLSSQKESMRELRGCIGYLDARLSLRKATINAAINAAVADPRFPPVSSSELPKVIFEVNALGEPSLLKGLKPVEYPKSINIGSDGLIVISGEARGILLPEVPVEWGWNPEEFLAQCSMKAGLHPDAWLDVDSKVYVFQSDIFQELEPFGRIVRVNLRQNVSSH
jgi:uncharacterized protein (TIGR00296 family)